MFHPIKVIDVDFGNPLQDIRNLEDYGGLQALIRLYGTPIGYVQLPLLQGSCTKDVLVGNVLQQLGRSLIQGLLRHGLPNPLSSGEVGVEDLFCEHSSLFSEDVPLVTIAVCTRDRTEQLAECLCGLEGLNYPSLDVLVVDNAPTDRATEYLIRNNFPKVRYVQEYRPGLNWARNRAIQEARGDIIAFTDDDAVADLEWVNALVRIFSENPGVMAVTGLVVPSHLETEAQVLFEQYGGMGKGFTRRWFRLKKGNFKTNNMHISSGNFGCGANMAYRRNVFQEIGGFDPALDVGTVTNGGGDLEMFFRVLQEGYMLVYEPSAIVRHSHRRTIAELKRQLTTWGIGFHSYLVRSALMYPGVRLAIVRFGIFHLWNRYFSPYLSSLLGRSVRNRSSILAEFFGVLPGLFRYHQARAIANTLAQDADSPDLVSGLPPALSSCSELKRVSKIAIRMIDLSRPLYELGDVADYGSVGLYVTWRDTFLDRVDIENHWQLISVDRLRESIVGCLGLRLLDLEGNRSLPSLENEILTTLTNKYSSNFEEVTEQTGDVTKTASTAVPAFENVSIVVVANDCPNHLRSCLRSLSNLQTSQPFEIIVVGNDSTSALTRLVVADFPGVIFVQEPHNGLSDAKNAGILASRGDIIVTIDDDMTFPACWLDKLLAPFSRKDVMAVTGNILPRELETEAQILFDAHRNLEIWHRRVEVDREWDKSFTYGAAPILKFGRGAHEAFRASIFTNPKIGLLDLTLGNRKAGKGGCEDIYLFYRILKERGRLVYEPTAYAWCSYEADFQRLRCQRYEYSKGHVAYLLTTWLNDNDLRALFTLLVELPKFYTKQIMKILLARSGDPFSLFWHEILGYLSGPFALWKSRREVKHRSGATCTLPRKSQVKGHTNH